MAPFWHRWSYFAIINLSVFHLADKCFTITNLINLRIILFLEYRKTPETLRFRGEYSCAVTPQVRQTGNRLSGLAGTAYASLFT